jgi:hypothetical protein
MNPPDPQEPAALVQFALLVLMVASFVALVLAWGSVEEWNRPW